MSFDRILLSKRLPYSRGIRIASLAGTLSSVLMCETSLAPKPNDWMPLMPLSFNARDSDTALATVRLVNVHNRARAHAGGGGRCTTPRVTFSVKPAGFEL